MTGSIPLVVIQGPTAVGKTSLAIEIARALNGEVVNADSRQVYRFMDIGTAKPAPAQQSLVAHHLIDIVNPDETLSLTEYQAAAEAAIRDIHTRKRLPLLVGGTGQYITGLIEGWRVPDVPPNATLRAELEAFAAEHGTSALHARLHDLDPVAAGEIDYRNVRRVIRALEVCLESGQPFSQQKRRLPPPYHLWQCGLTMARERLYARADQRLEGMLAQGFLEEVKALLQMGYNPSLPAMSALGYVQLATHLLGNCTLDEALVATRQATRDFIRRQYTWFRGHDTGILWFDSETTSADVLIELIAAWQTKEIQAG